MWRPYVELAKIYFPNAQIIVDKYHFARQVSWAMENVRKKTSEDNAGSSQKILKRSRHLILTRYHKLKGERKKACDLMLMYNDDLRLTHFLKRKVL